MSQNGLPDGTKTGKGSVADEQTKAIWAEAYRIYQLAQVEASDSKVERTERIGYVAERMGITRKAAKRRIKNYEGWQKRLDPSFQKFVPDMGREGRRRAAGRHEGHMWQRERHPSAPYRGGVRGRSDDRFKDPASRFNR